MVDKRVYRNVVSRHVFVHHDRRREMKWRSIERVECQVLKIYDSFSIMSIDRTREENIVICGIGNVWLENNNCNYSKENANEPFAR